MTAYFDKKLERLRQWTMSAEINPSEEVLGRLVTFENELVRDISICSAMPEFPEEIAAKLDDVILWFEGELKGARLLPATFVHERAELMSQFVTTLHGVFHELGELGVVGFSDDPFEPHRTLHQMAVTRRSQRVETSSNAPWRIVLPGRGTPS